MHEMQTIGTDNRGVCLSRGSTRLHFAKTAKWIKVLFGVKTLESPRNIILDGSPKPHTLLVFLAFLYDIRGKTHSMQPSPTYFSLFNCFYFE